MPKLSKLPELASGKARIFNPSKASGLRAHRLSVYSMGGSQSVVFGPIAQEAAAATSRNLIEMQILRTHPRATDSEIPGWGLASPTK